jgi:hypothetical protein
VYVRYDKQVEVGCITYDRGSFAHILQRVLQIIHRYLSDCLRRYLALGIEAYPGYQRHPTVSDYSPDMVYADGFSRAWDAIRRSG